MAAAASSTPSDNQEVKLHPYQKAGPKGAYEIKQVYQTRNGVTGSCLYIRVDMPGVPENGAVKVVKYSDRRTVTFNGRAPMVWPQFDTSERVYAGYVVVDRDPAEVKEEYFVKNGCFRLFLPECEGSLHFLSAPLPPATPDDDTVMIDDPFIFNEKEYVTFIEHAPEEPSGIKLRGGRPEHINPSLLSGIKGVYEHKLVKTVGDHSAFSEYLVYVRVDVPMIDYRGYTLAENADGISFALYGFVDCPFDEEGREFRGSVNTKCDCCAYVVIQQEIRDGVVRFLARKSSSLEQRKLELDTYPCTVYSYKPPRSPGDVLRLMYETWKLVICRKIRRR